VESTLPSDNRKKHELIRSLTYAAVAALAVSAVSVLPAGAFPGRRRGRAAGGRRGIRAGEPPPAHRDDHSGQAGPLLHVEQRGGGQAERINGFTRTRWSAEISMFNREVDGVIPVHRLRLRNGHQSSA
jgi:hypothetical protein